MDLIDSYVTAVGERLRASRRSEVEAELRAGIMDALEGRGGSVNSEADVVAVLTELGEPSRVAAEYQPSAQYLIGPELYPLLRRVAGLLLGTLVVASAIAYGLKLLLGGLVEFRAGELLLDTMGVAWRAAVVAVVVLVAVFAGLQRAELRVPKRERGWDPRSLSGVRQRDRAPRIGSVLALGVAAVVLMILGDLGQSAAGSIADVPGALRPLIREAVLENIMLLQLGLVLSALVHAVVLVQGRWRSYTRGLRLLGDAVGVFVFARLPVQLFEHRAALLAAGTPASVLNWLLVSAVVTGATVLVIVVVSEVRSWRRPS